jgi:hypothetical protein
MALRPLTRLTRELLMRTTQSARSRRSALVHHGGVPAPSPGRVLVEMQKVVTRVHCAVLESPAGRFASRIAGQSLK